MEDADYIFAGKFAQFSFTYEKVNRTDSLQPSSCDGPLVIDNRRIIESNLSFLLNIECVDDINNTLLRNK